MNLNLHYSSFRMCCVCVEGGKHTCMQAIYMREPPKVIRGHQIPLELELHTVVSSWTRVLVAMEPYTQPFTHIYLVQIETKAHKLKVNAIKCIESHSIGLEEALSRPHFKLILVVFKIN